MSEGKWSGGSANRAWTRPGSRRGMTAADIQLGHRLYEQMRTVPFLCDGCGMMHPLQEHHACREAESARPNIIAAARQSLTAAPRG